MLHSSPRSVSLLPSSSSAGLRKLLLPGPEVRPLLGRSVHMEPSRWAGHNKWSKVKHIKGPKDDARARLFMKLGLMVRIAVKEGGPNPLFNAALSSLVEQCRNHNMPKASIDTAIRTAEKAKAGAQHMFEAKGPGGCVLLIEVLTDNNNRTHQDLRYLLTKNGGALVDGARHPFERKGVVLAEARGMSPDDALELAIEAGAEDFICDQAELRSVRTSLEDRGVHVVSSGPEFVSRSPSLLDPSQLEAASALLEALNNHSDVMRVWDNIQPQP
ncbi:hypothetical protein NHX12_025506 [Muraenolepis orangiensis]|uniref:Translational activator of cytochrome c oxidase 1 n=1 Tax=Muraenolepis orangiensis TaxID=630683 RepID=A0A9Q0EK44_9TELE|nr:hypothetical protein NHX12_025506 [Muraenolepis orangiensis]